MNLFNKILLFLGFISFIACNSSEGYKHIEDIKDHKWSDKTTHTFDFEVKDVSKPYNIYYFIRNTPSYPFYNLYIDHTLTASDSTKHILEHSLKQMNLFDPTTGKPLGDGLGDIFDHKIMVNKNIRFAKAGHYTVGLKHYMRVEPLEGVLSVGISVEPVAVK